MSERANHSTETFFDVNGYVLIGRRALEAHLDAGGHPADVLPLAEVVTNTPERFTPAESPIEWTHDNMVDQVNWLGHELLGPSTRITQNLLSNLRRLGLGASSKRIRSQGSYSTLYTEANLANTRRRYIYEDWDIDDFTNFVCRIAATTPKTRSIKDRLNELARVGDTPSYKVITRRTRGGIKELLARGGYYDFQRATDEDYLDWGVDFKFANNGRPLEPYVFRLLSPKRLAPSYRAALGHFKTTEHFDVLVDDRYFAALERMEHEHREIFQRIIHEIHEGALPTELFLECQTEADLCQSASKFWLINELCPSIEPSDRLKVAKRSIKSVAKFIVERGDGTITMGDVEETGLMLGIFDYLWPTPPKNALKI